MSTYDDLDGALTNLGGDTQTGTITQDKFYDAFGNEFSTAAEASASDIELGAVGGEQLLGGDLDVLQTEGFNNQGIGGLTTTNTQLVNTINTQTVTDTDGLTYTVDTAVDANGNTSVSVTNNETGDSTTTDVNTGTLNSVNVGSGTSIIVDTSNTTETNAVDTTVLERKQCNYNWHRRHWRFN